MNDSFDDIWDQGDQPKQSFDQLWEEKPQQKKVSFDQLWNVISQPVTVTLGRESVGQLAERKVGAKPFAEAFEKGGGPVRNALAFAKSYGAGLAGDIADIAQTPASYLPIPGGKFIGKQIGKIPVGKTTVGKIATEKFGSFKEIRGKIGGMIKGDPDQIVKEAGGKFIGLGEGLSENDPFVYYNTPSGSTQVVKMSELSVEKIKSKIDVYEKKFLEAERKKLIDSAEKKLKKQEQFDLVKETIEKRGNPPDQVERLNKLIEKNKLTPQEEQALFSEISGKPAPPPAPPGSVPAGAAIPPGQKELGFIKSMKESPVVPQTTKKAIEALPPEKTSYTPYSDAEAIAKAQKRIADDPEGALAEVLTAKEPTKDTGAMGIELMRRARDIKNTELEVNIAEKLASEGLRAGQFTQSLSILDKLSPEGVLLMASRQLKKAGKSLTPELAEQLKAQADKIRVMPEGWYKIKEIQRLTEMIAEQVGRTSGQWISELANIPRTLTASLFDFSFGFRQGAFLLPSFRKEWAEAFKKQFGSFVSEKQYDELMDSIVKHPLFRLAVDSGMDFTEISSKAGGNLLRVEERYMGGGLAKQIPIIGRGVEMTERAFNAMANKMRMDVFAKMHQDLLNTGRDLSKNPRLAKQVANFVMNGTGRGGLSGSFAKSAELLNAFFFSPHLMSSRLTLLNPLYYVTREPGLRKQALKSLFSFIGLGATILGVAKMMGAEVETDLRSADAFKIKIGNLRIDVWGGFAQYVRMAVQQKSGQYISTTTGKIATLGEGYRPLSRYDILLRQIESKEAPIFSLMTEILKQQTWNGEPVNVPKAIATRFVPMMIQDMYDLAKEEPDLIPFGVLAGFGFGINTYSDQKTELIREAIPRIRKNKENITAVSREIAKKVYKDKFTPDKVGDIRNKILQEEIIKDNPHYIEIVSAGSSDKKIEILRKMREKYDAKQMRRYEMQMIRTKMVSPETIIKSRKNK